MTDDLEPPKKSPALTRLLATLSQQPAPRQGPSAGEVTAWAQREVVAGNRAHHSLTPDDVGHLGDHMNDWGR